MKKNLKNNMFWNILISFLILLSFLLDPVKPTSDFSQNIYSLNKFIGLFSFLGIYNIVSNINKKAIGGGEILYLYLYV